MKAPIFSAYARTPKHMLAVVRVLEEDTYQNEPPSEDEKRFPALFAFARSPFDIRVVYDEQPEVKIGTVARFVADPNDPKPEEGWEHKARTADELLPRLAELLTVEWNRLGLWLHGWDDAALEAREDVCKAMDSLGIHHQF